MKQLLLPIRALCTGQSLLTNTEEVALIAILKNANVPSCITVASQSPGEKETPPQPIKESKRARSDLSSSILEQLTMPLQDFAPSVSNSSESAPEGTKTSTEAAGNDTNSDTKVHIILEFFEFFQIFS